jgi:hypothetical protein
VRRIRAALPVEAHFGVRPGGMAVGGPS